MNHSSLVVARYFLDKAASSDRGLSPLKLIKLTYIAHGWMLGLYGKPLIKDDIESWRYGPMIPTLYHKIKKYGNKYAPQNSLSPIKDEFDEYERGVIDEVYDKYGNFTAIQLSEMTHTSDTPWDIARNKLSDDIISNDLIENHYNEIYEKSHQNDMRENEKEVHTFTK